MRDHKDDLVAILAAVNLTPVDEYAKELTLASSSPTSQTLSATRCSLIFLRLRREQQLRLRCRSCRCFCYLNDFRGNSLKHFLEYAKARMLEEQHAETYRVYVSDALRIISENTARFGGGTFVKQRYYDVINPPEG